MRFCIKIFITNLIMKFLLQLLVAHVLLLLFCGEEGTKLNYVVNSIVYA